MTPHEALEQVRALHTEALGTTFDDWGNEVDWPHCVADRDDWPCETAAILDAVAPETPVTAERLHAWVEGRCPACGRAGLFVGAGGYVTCSQDDCPDPGAPHDAVTPETPVAVETDAHHRVTITLADGYPWYRFTCTAPADALCRADWSCDCEELYDAQVRNGMPAHRSYSDDPDTWHAGVFKADFCGLKDWFDGSGDHPLNGEFTVPVGAVWEGDYYTFTVRTPATPERTVSREQVEAAAQSFVEDRRKTAARALRPTESRGEQPMSDREAEIEAELAEIYDAWDLGDELPMGEQAVIGGLVETARYLLTRVAELEAQVAAVRALVKSNGAWRGEKHIRVTERRDGFEVVRSAVWVDDVRAALDSANTP